VQEVSFLVLRRLESEAGQISNAVYIKVTMANPIPVECLNIGNGHLYEAILNCREGINQRVNNLEQTLQERIRTSVDEANTRNETRLRAIENRLDLVLNRIDLPQSNGETSAHAINPRTGPYHLKSIRYSDLDFESTGREHLGAGGFGTVYKAKLNGRKVAVKELKGDNNSGNQELLNELLTMHCYPWENILQLLTYCETPQCLVFQYMENGSLAHKLRDTDNPLSWEDRMKISSGTASGLHHLHANNIVHGDIKSSNILLNKYNEPKIGDFGTVKLLYKGDKETTKMFFQNISGTRYYLPNWLFQGIHAKKVRKPIDVYSFGIVLLEIMSGRLPTDKDANGWTLKDYVVNQLPNQPEPPDEYIANADLHNMTLHIQTREGPRMVVLPIFLYQMASLCTTREHTHMPTIAQVHGDIDGVYSYFSLNSGNSAPNNDLQRYELMTDGEHVSKLGL